MSLAAAREGDALLIVSGDGHLLDVTGWQGVEVIMPRTFTDRDALERTYIYDPVPAWKPGGTAMSRLGEAPKIHLVDPGLSAHLLGIDEDALLSGASTPLVDALPAVRDGGLFGALFESLVAQSMRTYAPFTWSMRTCARVAGRTRSMGCGFAATSDAWRMKSRSTAPSTTATWSISTGSRRSSAISSSMRS